MRVFLLKKRKNNFLFNLNPGKKLLSQKHNKNTSHIDFYSHSKLIDTCTYLVRQLFSNSSLQGRDKEAGKKKKKKSVRWNQRELLIKFRKKLYENDEKKKPKRIKKYDFKALHNNDLTWMCSALALTEAKTSYE